MTARLVSSQARGGMPARFRFRTTFLVGKVVLQKNVAPPRAPWDIEVYDSDWRDAKPEEIAEFEEALQQQRIQYAMHNAPSTGAGLSRCICMPDRGADGHFRQPEPPCPLCPRYEEPADEGDTA